MFLFMSIFIQRQGPPTPCPIPLAVWERGGIDGHSGRVPYCLGIKMFRITQIKMLIFKDTAGKMTCTLEQFGFRLIYIAIPLRN